MKGVFKKMGQLLRSVIAHYNEQLSFGKPMSQSIYLKKVGTSYSKPKVDFCS